MSAAAAAESSPTGNLQHLVYDVYYVTHDGLFRPDFEWLVSELRFLSGQAGLLGQKYQDSVLNPFQLYLDLKLKKEGFEALFLVDEGTLSPAERNRKRQIVDVAEGLLQRNHESRYDKSSFKALQAFQAVVTDLHIEVFSNAFFASHPVPLPPLAKWGSRKTPYTHPLNVKSKLYTELGVNCGIVNLPVEHKHGGLLAWSSLTHEIAGHHFLRSANDKIIPTLAKRVEQALRAAYHDKQDAQVLDKLIVYWKACAEEAAADVIGMLMLGPAFVLGFVGYLRGKRGGKLSTSGPLHAARSRNALKLSTPEGYLITFVEHLSSTVQLNESGIFGHQDSQKKVPIQYERMAFPPNKHPLDVLRFQLMIHVLKQWGGGYDSWVTAFEGMLKEDLGEDPIVLNEFDGEVKSVHERKYGNDFLLSSAITVGQALMDAPLPIDGGDPSAAAAAAGGGAASSAGTMKNLPEIFQWAEKDNGLVAMIREKYRSTDKKVVLEEMLFLNGARHRHILAAAMLESCENAEIPLNQIFHRMKKFLRRAPVNPQAEMDAAQGSADT